MTRALGMTLVELLVGLAVGLFLVAGASGLMATQLQAQKGLQLELQVQQEMRAIAAFMRRELGAAGAWGQPDHGVWAADRGKGRPNPFADVDFDAGTQTLRFAASQSATDPALPEDDRLDDADLKAFRLRGSTLEFRTDGGRFQPLNDPSTVAIRRFEVQIERVERSLEALCPQSCDGWGDCPPRLLTRSLRVSLDAEASQDAGVQQRWTWRYRLPADTLSGSCRP